MLQVAGSFLARLLWPQRCPACQKTTAEGRIFCPPCDVTVLALDRACPGCALDDRTAAGMCHACRVRPFPFSRARASLVYGGAVADALVRLKHGRGLAGARLLGRFLVPLLDWAAADGIDAVVPVPLHPRRLRQRGFNQALELVREALDVRAARARAFALPQVPLPVWADALRRQRDTPTLGRDPAPVRRCRVAGAFTVASRERVRNRRLLLADDVMTTGATFAECARTLMDAGAKEVRVAALARALP
jgi:predicted amidophosphoribosyltransferase